MEHVVRFTTTEGRDAQHIAKTLEDALRFVERLRNNEEASVVRVFRMQEVPITFKTYYKVELRPGAGDDVENTATPSEARPVEESVRDSNTAAPEADHADGAGRKLFSRA